LKIRTKPLFFKVAYRIGRTPWDGHPLSSHLQDLIEGPGALPAGRVIDIGCGTGDTAIYLARHGWQVTAVDISAKALNQARAKATAQHVHVNFVRADVTHLTDAADIIGRFDLVVDTGCLHGMNDDDRDRYVSELAAIAAPDARLLILAFVTGGQFGVRGIDQPEVDRRFLRQWLLLSSGGEAAMTTYANYPARHYLLERRD
jgi:2-polyprenyl-3-methyl-5-hydroxy-6-metoxy-1,4-benzoquinol methylase